jgi:hypothetical protein
MDDSSCAWQIAGEAWHGDAVGAALSRPHATLWYGPHCLCYSRTHDAAGNFLLRLQSVGHLLPAGIEAPVLVLRDHGPAAEQLIAPEGGRQGTQVVQRLGRALFAEVARSLDLEAQWP